MAKVTPPVPGMADEDTLGLVILRPGDSGNAVRVIQDRLATLGFYRGISDGAYGPVTQTAIQAFQKKRGLKATGLVDHQTLQALGYEVDNAPPAAVNSAISLETVARMFPDAPMNNVRGYFPLVIKALQEQGIADTEMVLMALATIRVETGSFAPISEYVSKYNTEPGGRPYALYDFRKDLGNGAKGDGDRYKGRGFIQLTGKSNYQTYSRRLGLNNLLQEKPELANDPMIAARILACFLKDKESVIRSALARDDYAMARKAVNGGTHGLDQFKLAYQTGANLTGIA